MPVLEVYSIGLQILLNHWKPAVYPVENGTVIKHTEITLVCFESILNIKGYLETTLRSNYSAPILDMPECLMTSTTGPWATGDYTVCFKHPGYSRVATLHSTRVPDTVPA